MYRRTETTLWEEHWFIDFTADQKYLYLYFISSPIQSACGVCLPNLNRVAFDTNLPIDRVRKAFEGDMEPHLKRHAVTGHVALRNFMIHQNCGGKWRVKADADFAALPEEIREWATSTDDSGGKPIDSLSKPIEAYPSVTVSDTGAVTEPDLEDGTISSTKVDSSARACRPPDCPHQKIVDLYHQHLPMMPAVKDWTANRQRILKARWNEKTERQSLEHWAEFFRYVAESDFLCGRAEPDRNGRTFIAYLEWLVRPTNYVKVIEGKYHPSDTEHGDSLPIGATLRGISTWQDLAQSETVFRLADFTSTETDAWRQARIDSNLPGYLIKLYYYAAVAYWHAGDEKGKERLRRLVADEMGPADPGDVDVPAEWVGYFDGLEKRLAESKEA